jgi:outer membrane protein TolC
MKLYFAVLTLAGFCLTANALSLEGYLEQVKSQNPEARAAQTGVKAAELAQVQADGQFSPELYSEYRLFDSRSEPTSNFAPTETRGRMWKIGVTKQTSFGLSADAYFTSQRNQLLGVNTAFIPLNDYEQSALGINLSQSLWRNSFGSATRSQYEADKSASRQALLKERFHLKDILLKAENTYWSLVSYNQMVKLQKENVERARKLRDWTKRKARLRLSDDVDALQGEASYRQREIDLQNMQNQRQEIVRAFNTLRGSDRDTVEELDDLPTQEFMLKTVKDPKKRMSREDFQIIYEQARQSAAEAKASRSLLWPKLDITGGLSSNGLDPNTPPAYNEATSGHNPDWNVGIVFSVPLDYSLIGNMRHAYEARARAAKDQAEQARFSESRVWDELLQKNREAQDIFEKSIALEKLQTEVVKRQRRLLLNGRSTTFQTIDSENGLASAQISRLKAQLDLLQIHNVIKQFEEVQ